MIYNIKTFSDYGNVTVNDNITRFVADKDYDEAFFGMELNFSDWEDDAFILMPACAYNGNRFNRSGRFGYPITYTLAEMGKDAEPTIPEVPALNPDGSGQIEVTSGDMSVPCVGIFYRKEKKGFLLYTKQNLKGKNLGFTVKNGSVTVSYPAKRNLAYRWSNGFAENADSGIEVKMGEILESEFCIFTFDCESIDALFEKFFDTRKTLMSDKRSCNLYTNEMFAIMEKHFNEHLWSGEFYGSVFGKWAPGWCGYGMSTHTLLLYGSEESRARAEKTIDFMTIHQSDAGFYYFYDPVAKVHRYDNFGSQVIDENGKNLSGKMHLIRRSGDCLVYLIKQIEIINKPSWKNSARKCADGLVKVYDENGTFGQYVDIETGEVVVGTSCAGASCVAGLVRAYDYFKDEKYLDCAKKAGDMYYEKFLSEGISSGAISDAMCSPDSESITSFVEAYVLLFEVTQDEKWLYMAKVAANILSSWVVTYSYEFPEESEFYRLGINTVGSVFANVQNKHSAPGLCTSSGEYIYKLYLHTGDERYLDLILDIASFIPQCISTDERPIFARMLPEGGVVLEKAEKLKPGYVSERVNMSDWEGFECVGNVFNASCWCESSLVLTFGDLVYKYKLNW